MSSSTFSALLRDYLLGGYIPPRYWQRYKDRLWLHHGIRPFPGLRERVLAKQMRRSAYQQKQAFKEMITRPSPLMALITKDDSWTGTMIVPFRPKMVNLAAELAGPQKEKFAKRLRRRLGLSR